MRQKLKFNHSHQVTNRDTSSSSNASKREKHGMRAVYLDPGALNVPVDDLPALSAEIIAPCWPGENGSVQLQMHRTAVTALQEDRACEDVLVVWCRERERSE